MPTRVIPRDTMPAEALQLLKEGNFRFVNNLKEHHDLLQQVNATKDNQWPFAAILSCMDSRTSAELIFDLGLGDIFSIRIAGNVVTDGILGSLEYATAVAGAKLIVVLGHSGCGAIRGACDDLDMGHLTGLLAHIRPSVEQEQSVAENRNSTNPEFVQKVAYLNVYHSVSQIMERSPLIAQLVKDGRLMIVGGMYDVATGIVEFYDDIAWHAQRANAQLSAQ